MADYWSMSDEELEALAIKYNFVEYWAKAGQRTVIDRQAIIRQLLLRDAALAQQIPDKEVERRRIGF